MRVYRRCRSSWRPRRLTAAFGCRAQRPSPIESADVAPVCVPTMAAKLRPDEQRRHIAYRASQHSWRSNRKTGRVYRRQRPSVRPWPGRK